MLLWRNTNGVRGFLLLLFVFSWHVNSEFFNLYRFGLKILFVESRWENLKFTGVDLFECLRLDIVSVFQLFIVLLLWDLLLSRGNSGWNWLSCHLNWLLLGVFNSSWASDLNGSSKKCSVMNLTELRFVSTSMRVDIECFQIRTIYASSISWIHISITICAESWLSKVCRDSRVRQESRCQLKFGQLLSQLLLLFIIQLSFLGFENLPCLFLLLLSLLSNTCLLVLQLKFLFFLLDS